MTPEDELAAIEGFDENVAERIEAPRRGLPGPSASEQEERRIALGVTDEVAEIEALSAKDARCPR